MALEVYQSCSSSGFYELFVDFLFFCGSGFVVCGVVTVLCKEWNVHQRAASNLSCCVIEVAFVVVEVVIKVISLFLVALEHSFCSAVCFNPMQNLTKHVDSVAWRSIVHRIIISMSLVAEHSRSSGTACLRFTNQIFADDYESNAGRSQVLLSTGKKQTELANVQRLTQNAGRNISYQWDVSAVRNVLVVSSHNCVVEADVSVVIVAFNLFNPWNVRIILVFAACNNININAKLFSLSSSLLCPDSSFDVGSLSSVNAQIFSNHSKLSRTAALNKKHLVVIRHVH